MVESTINFEQDRVESVTQIDAAKTLSDKVFAASICVTDSTLSCSKFIVILLPFYSVYYNPLN